jgi:hypothetical protein
MSVLLVSMIVKLAFFLENNESPLFAFNVLASMVRLLKVDSHTRVVFVVHMAMLWATEMALKVLLLHVTEEFSFIVEVFVSKLSELEPEH